MAKKFKIDDYTKREKNPLYDTRTGIRPLLDRSFSSPNSYGAGGLLSEDSLLVKGFQGKIKWSDIEDDDNLRAVKLYDAIVAQDGSGQFICIEDALNAGKDRIFVKSGTYITNSTILINRSNVLITGENRNDTILKFPDVPIMDFNLINITGSEVIINNIGFDGNRIVQTTAIDTLGVIGDNCQIINCSFIDVHRVSIFILNADNTLVDGNFIDGSRSYGIVIQSPLGTAYYNTIVNNYVGTVSDTAGAYVIQLGTGAKYNIVSNNYFLNGYYSCTILEDSNVFTNNICVNSAYHSIYVTSMYNTISSNIVLESNRSGIKIDGGKYNTVLNNSIKDSSQQANNTYSAILLENHAAEGDATHNTISGNIIRETETNKAAYGIREDDANQNYNIITSNIVQGAVTSNISVQGLNTEVGHNIH